MGQKNSNIWAVHRLGVGEDCYRVFPGRKLQLGEKIGKGELKKDTLKKKNRNRKSMSFVKYDWSTFSS